MTTRTQFLTTTAATMAATVAAGSVSAEAQTAPMATMMDEASFVAAIRTAAKHRQVIGSARVDNGTVLQYVVNSLNGFVRGWNEPAANVQIAIVVAGTSVAIALDDDAWRTYRLADVIHREPTDMLTVDASAGNPWSHASATLAPNADRSIPALQRRNAKLYACDTALGDLSNRIVALGANGGLDAFAIHAQLRTHVLPAFTLVPAGIAAIAVMQENGYTYFCAAL